MDRDVLGGRSQLTTGKASPSPRSLASDAFASTTGVTTMISTGRAHTDLDRAGKIDFDSVYKYPLNDETRSNTQFRAGSTIKDRGSPYIRT